MSVNMLLISGAVKAGTLGSATSPNGQVIESTSVYSRISYQVDGYFGVTVPAEKDKLVDIVKNN